MVLGCVQTSGRDEMKTESLSIAHLNSILEKRVLRNCDRAAMFPTTIPHGGGVRASMAGRDDTPASEVGMEICDAQRENRSVYIGGFWGQLVSSVIWLVAAALGTWVSPKASILAAVIGGFFIFPLTQLL